MYQGHSKEAIIILEVVASHDLLIWYSFFEMSGSHTDINVLQRSPVCRMYRTYNVRWFGLTIVQGIYRVQYEGERPEVEGKSHTI